MNKRKILLLAAALLMVGVLAVGGTLAYFTDTDHATNVFTIGKIDITLEETFEPNSLLIPNIDINKDVTITLEDGSVPAYVWYTWSIDANLDNMENAGENIVHVNHAGQNWDDYYTDGNTKGYEGTATSLEQTWDVDWKVETIDGKHVYTNLYHGVLEAGDTTTLAMTKVYLDSRVDTYKDEDGKVVAGQYTFLGELIDYNFSNPVEIEVNAYGIQAEGLSDMNNDGEIDVYDAYITYNNQKAAEAAN